MLRIVRLQRKSGSDYAQWQWPRDPETSQTSNCTEMD